MRLLRFALLAVALLLPLGPTAARQKGKSRMLSPEEQRKLFVLPKGFEIELVAAEPLVANPITLALDQKGRILVSESHTYRFGPAGSPVKPFTNPVVRLQPKAGGKGLERVVIAEGYDDPVMGIAVKGDRLWLTANNYLYRYDYDGTGKASNRTTLVTDRNKAWNPFGLFVLEWGPEGDLYLSVGNHPIALEGPNGKMTGRGTSGIVLRMKPDGRDMERLVHGLRVPYSFEYDPFGQLWLLSNGQGNPDRFVRVIEGVDYHCYSRPAASNEWLAGRHPLAPPCLELPSGACTQLIRYYGANFPPEYQGSLFLDNWGAHGFDGPNRCIFRYAPDDRGDIVKKEKFLECKDPHFRPSHILLDADGSMLVADWYGRDDESDSTGRIWRVSYKGGSKYPLARTDLEKLSSAHHLEREAAIEAWSRKKDAVATLTKHAAEGPELGAANALWALVRMGQFGQVKAGLGHRDWKVRRLSAELLRRYRVEGREAIAAKHEEKDPAVRVVLARLFDGEKRRDALLAALRDGAAKDVHLRYEAAWHLAPLADEKVLSGLLGSDDDDLRLAGLIAIDVAIYENHSTKAAALATLGGALASGRDVDHLMTLVRLNADPSLVPAVSKLFDRPSLPAGAAAQALLFLRSQAKSLPPGVMEKVGKQFVEAVRSRAVSVRTPAEQVMLLSALESEGPTPFALGEVDRHLTSKAGPVRAAAHDTARRFGAKASSLAGKLWSLAAKGPEAQRLEAIGTLARVEKEPDQARWVRLLADSTPPIRVEAVRTWRLFHERPAMVEALIARVPGLLSADAAMGPELAPVLTMFGEAGKAALKDNRLAFTEPDRKVLTEELEAAVEKVPARDRAVRVAMGRLVFERNACAKCHKLDEDTLRAPGLRNVGKGQKKGYLIESVLYPSAVIKTGFETERVVLKTGKVLTGLVRDEGTHLRILDADHDVRVRKNTVERREVQKLSIMPEGQEKVLSRRELEDLIAFLTSLK